MNFTYVHHFGSTWSAKIMNLSKSFFERMDQRTLEISKQCLFLFTTFLPVMFSCWFLMFWFCLGLFSVLSVWFCFSFPYFQPLLFESIKFAKCFQICRARPLMICCAWHWLKIMVYIWSCKLDVRFFRSWAVCKLFL